MKRIDFLEKYQSQTPRDYIARATENDKAECAAVARKWGRDYWDGDRKYGYGGYHYDGRWLPIARELASHYELKAGDRILDVGCGKGFLLYEFTQAVPGIEVYGIDVSQYAIDHARWEIQQTGLRVGNATELPYPNRSFDFVYSINLYHNLSLPELALAIPEFERVSKGRAWINVESFRNEREKANLLYWQLTCLSFHSPESWEWLYRHFGYTGDFGFIWFE